MTFLLISLLALGLVVPTVAVPSAYGVLIDIGHVTGTVGQQVDLPVSISTEGADVNGVQLTIRPGPKARVAARNGHPACSVNPTIHREGTSFQFRPPGCTPGQTCGDVLALVLTLQPPADPLPDGVTLFTCALDVLGSGPGTIECLAPGASDLFDTALDVVCDNGRVFGEPGTPPPTATQSPTPTPEPCVGDCNGSGAVAIDELILAVRIALGDSPMSACLAIDDDRNGEVTIGELVRAVANALGGCIATPRTPTPTRTPTPLTSCPFGFNQDFRGQQCLFRGYWTGPFCRGDALYAAVGGNGRAVFVVLDLDPGATLLATPYGASRGYAHASLNGWADASNRITGLTGQIAYLNDGQLEIAPTRSPFTIDDCAFEYYRAEFVRVLSE